MDLLKIDYENPENEENARKLMQKEYSNVRTFAKEDIHAIKKLWSEPGLRQCFEEGREYQLSDSQRIIDIRGPRTERRKWIHYFENIPALMFIAALSDYDHIEIYNTNRMDLAKTLFKTYINNQWFRNCGIMLLLNKKDVLEEKILVSHLVDYFPEFKENINTCIHKDDRRTNQTLMKVQQISLTTNTEHVRQKEQQERPTNVPRIRLDRYTQ
ncbi:G protein alpha q subunit,Guanine nucleotide-binding protein subunit alpha-11,Guanine nucleotide-binding protein G(q) subunit alpha [Mytilus coruscus]|uniref:G protein alpha q subunit,Guanine nucleotide-binding protein subunit alpha-11,Guanine nucleotide-binding protein G(Q) subunit alpha n=1 Tax=Mytilus coruscus TaxID=42192 RepID=A0A6J8DMI9_MYTCO|nr:G protein alpha q subunit,Guanine nucleotide-binding protein subunit alpha-11,Guanine nucleotide-binding protein G(q) subunit alpha [Mytilus coruscus]